MGRLKQYNNHGSSLLARNRTTEVSVQRRVWFEDQPVVIGEFLSPNRTWKCMENMHERMHERMHENTYVQNLVSRPFFLALHRAFHFSHTFRTSVTPCISCVTPFLGFHTSTRSHTHTLTPHSHSHKHILTLTHAHTFSLSHTATHSLTLRQTSYTTLSND